MLILGLDPGLRHTGWASSKPAATSSASLPAAPSTPTPRPTWRPGWAGSTTGSRP